MGQSIEDLPPQSGRYLMEDGSVFNMADFFANHPMAVMYTQDTEPDDPEQGDFWYDTSAGTVLKIYNGATWDTV